MKWSTHTGNPIERVNEQYIPLPLAIVNSDEVHAKVRKVTLLKFMKVDTKTHPHL